MEAFVVDFEAGENFTINNNHIRTIKKINIIFY